MEMGLFFSPKYAMLVMYPLSQMCLVDVGACNTSPLRMTDVGIWQGFIPPRGVYITIIRLACIWSLLGGGPRSR